MVVDQRQVGEAPGAGQGHASLVGTLTVVGQRAVEGRGWGGARGWEGGHGRVAGLERVRGHGSAVARTDSSAAGSPAEQGLGAVAQRLVGAQALEGVPRRLGGRGEPRVGVRDLVASVPVVASAVAAGRAAVVGRRSGYKGSRQVLGGRSLSDWGRSVGAWLLPLLGRVRQGGRTAQVVQAGQRPPGKGRQ